MRLPAGIHRVNYSQDMAIVSTRLQWILLISFLVFLMAIPLFASNYMTNLIIWLAINIVAVHGLNLLSGYCGQFSIGHAAFVAVGAYSSVIMTTNLGLPFLIALPLAGLVAGLVGLIFGLPSLRVRGLYLIMSTLAAQFIIQWLLLMDPGGLTGGIYGITAPVPKLGGFAFDSAMSYYYIAIPICILVTIMAKNLARMDIGRAFIAVRDNDIAAEAMGINLYRTKLMAFFIGCFLAGIAGSLTAHYVRHAAPENFGLGESVWYLGMIIIGGMGSNLGSILGVLFVRGMDEITMEISQGIGKVIPQLGAVGWAAFGQIFFGIVVILFLVYEPRGLAHRWELFKASYRLWPFSR